MTAVLDTVVEGFEVVRGHADELYLASTAESMTLHVVQDRRKVVPWPETVLQGLDSVARKQGRLPWPKQAGRRIEIKNPLYPTE